MSFSGTVYPPTEKTPLTGHFKPANNTPATRPNPQSHVKPSKIYNFPRNIHFFSSCQERTPTRTHAHTPTRTPTHAHAHARAYTRNAHTSAGTQAHAPTHTQAQAQAHPRAQDHSRRRFRDKSHHMRRRFRNKSLKIFDYIVL